MKEINNLGFLKYAYIETLTLSDEQIIQILVAFKDALNGKQVDISNLNLTPPFISLIVSGGHTNLVYIYDYNKNS